MDREPFDRLTWVELLERQRQERRAWAIEDERQQLMQLEEQRRVVRALVQAMLRANASMMAASSF
jgi:hypothetical protein